MRLGSSQKAVINFMKDCCPITASRIGDAIYEKTSCCASEGNGTGSMGGKATPEEIRRNWATKLLNELKKKGLVEFTKVAGDRFWTLTKKGKEWREENGQ